MSNRWKVLMIAAAAVTATIPAAASAGVSRSNLVTAAAQSPDHTTLVAAVKAAGLVDTLASGGPFTLFAPTDAAFARLPAGTVDKLLQPANRDRLRAVLTYHAVQGTFTAADLVKLIGQNGGRAILKTVQGGTLTATLSGGSVALTDATGGTAKVTTADLAQSNGVIHVTDTVSLPM